MSARPAAAPYQTVIHEGALRMKFGGAPVARNQLRHLLKLSEMNHVTIRVITFELGSFPGSGQTANYAYGSVPQLDAVQLDQAHGVAFIDTDVQLEQYRMLLDRLDSTALDESGFASRHPHHRRKPVKWRTAVPTTDWQSSSYCAQGEACLHVASAEDRTVRLTESADPTRAIVQTAPADWAVFLRTVKDPGRPSGGSALTVRTGPGDLVQLRGAGDPETVVTTTRAKWDAFVLGVLAGEFDHFADLPGRASVMA